MQNDLISRSALLKDFAERQELDRSGGDYADCFMNSEQTLSTEWWCVEDAVESAPTIDAVPVVRCKDCKHRGTSYECPFRHIAFTEAEGYHYVDCTTDDGFCSFGEKEDEA